MEKIADLDFESRVLKSDKPVLVDIYADWCQPCKMLAPTLEKVSKAYEGRASVYKMDGETAVSTVTAYNIGALPTLLFFKGGELVKKLTGLQTEKVLCETLDTLI